MGRFFRCFSVFMLLCATGFANGVGIVNAREGICLNLISSEVEVQVENQVALVTVSQGLPPTEVPIYRLHFMKVFRNFHPV